MSSRRQSNPPTAGRCHVGPSIGRGWLGWWAGGLRGLLVRPTRLSGGSAMQCHACPGVKLSLHYYSTPFSTCRSRIVHKPPVTHTAATLRYSAVPQCSSTHLLDCSHSLTHPLTHSLHPNCLALLLLLLLLLRHNSRYGSSQPTPPPPRALSLSLLITHTLYLTTLPACACACASLSSPPVVQSRGNPIRPSSVPRHSHSLFSISSSNSVQFCNRRPFSSVAAPQSIFEDIWSSAIHLFLYLHPNRDIPSIGRIHSFPSRL
jgi:hypothetical protein